MELNAWDQLRHDVHSGLTPWYVYRDKMRQIYLYFEAKRLKYAELELEQIEKYRRHKEEGIDFDPAGMERFTLGGQEAQKQFVEDYDRLAETVPIEGLAEGCDARGGSNAAGNPVRNLAHNANAYAYHLRSYPRATANAHEKYRSEFSPVNAINGAANDGKCWRPGRRTDARLTVELGRVAEVEKVTLTLALPEGQTKTWQSATLEFSDGTTAAITLQPTAEPQSFSFPATKTSSVTLKNLAQPFPLTDNGVAEIEVWGKDY